MSRKRHPIDELILASFREVRLPADGGQLTLEKLKRAVALFKANRSIADELIEQAVKDSRPKKVIARVMLVDSAYGDMDGEYEVIA